MAAVTEKTDDRAERLVNFIERNFGNPKLCPDLRKMASHLDVQRAEDALVGIGEKAAPQVLEALRRAKYEPLVGKLVKLLGEIGDEKAVPALTAMEKHRNRRLRIDVKNALKKIGARMKGEMLDIPFRPPCQNALFKSPSKYRIR